MSCEKINPLHHETPSSPERRRHLERAAIWMLAAGGCAGAGAAPAQSEEAAPDDDEAAQARPQEGDLLVRADAGEQPKPLRAEDVVAGVKPLQVYPMDPIRGTVRRGSRLNKLVLVRLDPESIDRFTSKRAADGLVAYSGVCTHEGCDVTEWSAEDQALLCFCHFSKFLPGEGGSVIAGPAPRNLPQLPLRVENGQVVVAGPFVSRPGVRRAA